MHLIEHISTLKTSAASSMHPSSGSLSLAIFALLTAARFFILISSQQQCRSLGPWRWFFQVFIMAASIVRVRVQFNTRDILPYADIEAASRLSMMLSIDAWGSWRSIEVESTDRTDVGLLDLRLGMHNLSQHYKEEERDFLYVMDLAALIITFYLMQCN